jgi:hypothetical protein
MPHIDWHQIYFVMEFLLAIFSIIIILYGIVKFIDSRISKKLVDAEFVKSIAHLLRPFAIFNEKGTVIVDRGAMSFIDDIEITIEKKLPQQIKLKLKKYMATAPILLSLDTDMLTIKEMRGNKFDWIYTVKYHGYNDREERRFHVEIVT